MKFKVPMRTLSAAIAIATLSGCGGGGGGGGAAPAETPRELTPLPEFLQAKSAECTFTENDTNVSLENYQGNLANVTGLTCDNAALTNLTGIDLLTALEQLTLTNSGLDNINDLVNNATLQKLNLSGNPLTDLSALNTLTDLTELDLSNSDLKNTAALLDMLNLAKLNLENNPLTDLTALASLVGLTDLDLSNTGLTDTSALASVTALQNLDLSDNELELVTELSNLVQLTALDLRDNVITDVMPLASLTAMESLQLSGNNTLECSNAFELKNSLNENAVDSMPAACDNVITLGNTSPESETIDNSLLEEPYGRVVIVGDYTTENLLMLKQGDNLALRLTTTESEKTVIFTGWFLDEANTVNVFEMPDGEEYSFSGLQQLTPLGQELTEAYDDYEGTNGRDLVFGLGGNDVIVGNSGDDIIIGGKGNDLLIGHRATIDEDGNVSSVINNLDSDTYLYNTGDGNDTIVDAPYYATNQNTLKFAADITEDNIILKQNGDDLVFFFDEANSVTLYRWFLGYQTGVMYIQFNDNDKIKAREWVKSKGYTSDDSTINGTRDPDVLRGSEQADTIIGDIGDDIIIGGKGDDLLIGHRATIDEDGNVSSVINNVDSDTYLYNTGDGNDTIVDAPYYATNQNTLKFAADITEDNIILKQNGDDLVFFFDEANSVTLYRWFLGYQTGVMYIQFNDNDKIKAREWVKSKGYTSDDSTINGTRDPDVLRGSEQADTIIGDIGDDIIIGGKGDDLLIGHRATIDEDGNVSSVINNVDSDTYLYNTGDGNDTIVDAPYYTTNQNTLKFAADITEDNITLKQNGDDLVFFFDEANSVTLYRWFLGYQTGVMYIQFNDNDKIKAREWVDTRLNPTEPQE